MAVLMLLVSTAAAEEMRTRKVVETVATVDWDSLPVVGAVIGSQTVGGRGLRDTCPPVALTHTEPELFEGGSYIIQMGFSEGEVAAASFTIPAGDFPLQVIKTEMIFAQSHWNPTTTVWSLLVYDGPPTTGTLEASFTSDDLILPHLTLPAGDPLSQAANLQVTVDPEDPEQIIIYNTSGTNTLTVGYRIDTHNNQTANPCFTAPPANDNAFPTVDNSGVSTQSQNWLYGLDCGPVGCPDNGGWATFAQLHGSPGQLCTPSGDWVIRVTYVSLNCGPTTGGCCHPTGICENEVLEVDCQGFGDAWHEEEDCATIDCTPAGACCRMGGCLQLTVQADCEGPLSGEYAGHGTDCTDDVCVDGACCIEATGECIENFGFQCDALGESYEGPGTVCDPNPCTQPIGACCFGTFCQGDQTEDACVGAVGEWAGPGTACPTPHTDLCPLCDDGDMDTDFDVDLQDFAGFQMCFDIAYAAGCKCADMDNDLDVDLDDYAEFESAVVGP